MATVSFEISTAMLTRMRAAIVRDQPALAGQNNTVLNEAARVHCRQLIKNWLVDNERAAAVNPAIIAATASVSIPGDAEIT